MRTPGVLALFLVVACGDSTPKATPSASPSETVSAAPKPSARPAVGKPPPIDLDALNKSLSCSGNTASGPCPVLDKFKSCREKWSPITQSGDGRWFGRGSIVKKGAFIEDYVILRTRRVGLADVAEGALGVKVAIDRLPQIPDVQSAAGPAVRALLRSDIPKKGNRAMTFVKELKKWSESYAQQADDHQIYVADGAGAYLCADPSTQALHVVRLSNKQDHPADGIYATIFPIKW